MAAEIDMARLAMVQDFQISGLGIFWMAPWTTATQHWPYWKSPKSLRLGWPTGLLSERIFVELAIVSRGFAEGQPN
jgi:hypothetical protein